MHNDAKNFSNEQLVSQSSEEQTSADGTTRRFPGAQLMQRKTAA
jgi:hypothetical protein